MPATALFQSFFLGGFECSTHEHPPGRRLDLITSTRHDAFALQDYAALNRLGIRTARDGIRWHRVERTPGRYRFADDLPLVRAARRTGTQVLWDLCHYGWPDGLSPFEPGFGARLAGLGAAFARVLRDEGEERPFFVPVNEISFVAWIGGTAGLFPPFTRQRGDELKQCLVRATIECIEAVRAIAPQARFCLTDPVIHVAGDRRSARSCREAAQHTLAQYAAWDMLAGRVAPQLGGRPDYLDVLGANYYIHNQWLHRNGRQVRMLGPGDAGYRPLSQMLCELYARHRRPLLVAETGIEGRRRAAWLRAVCGEVERSRAAGVPVEGVCLYPVLDYPGWADDRHCPTGLLGYADAAGRRAVYQPLADELRRQQGRFAPPTAPARAS